MCTKNKIWVQRFNHTTQKLPDMPPLSPCICQCMRLFFVKRPKFLAATSNLRVEQNSVHLGRFLHFSQKVVGVTLNAVYFMQDLTAFSFSDLQSKCSVMSIICLEKTEEASHTVHLFKYRFSKPYLHQHYSSRISFWISSLWIFLNIKFRNKSVNFCLAAIEEIFFIWFLLLNQFSSEGLFTMVAHRYHSGNGKYQFFLSIY